jgi:hypothetical protein
MMYRGAFWAICSLHCVHASSSVDDMVDGWNVTVLDPGSPGKYKISFEWEHVHEKAVTVLTANAQDDPRCDGSSNQVSDIDGLPYWMPRFIPRAVPAEVTAMTDISICFGGLAAMWPQRYPNMPCRKPLRYSLILCR